MELFSLQYRDYQQRLDSLIYSAWAMFRAVLAVSPTGSGKTVLFCNILLEHAARGVPCIALAHRQELVSQMSLTLARNGVRHRIIAPKKTIKNIMRLHVRVLGRDYYDPRSDIAVGGVDTVGRPKRLIEFGAWFSRVGLVVMDEAHHVLDDNKWGKAVALFPTTARVLGVTATPFRTDGFGLGAHADGIFQHMVVGPEMRWLINEGHLTDYKVFISDAHVDLDGISLDKAGEFNKLQLKERENASDIVGDVVRAYLEHAPGKLGVTFVSNVEIAQTIAKEYNAAGVPAEIISAKTPDDLRIDILQRFERRELLQLVNVDIFGEGFDLPALEVCSMARATMSLSLYIQQFGRVLRTLAGKTHGMIIDHVGNYMRHGAPDRKRKYTLDRRPKCAGPRDPDEVPERKCKGCSQPYVTTLTKCPHCKLPPAPPKSRAGPAFVNGNLFELSPEVLAQMRGDILAVDQAVSPAMAKLKYSPGIVQAGAAKQHRRKQEAQYVLRESLKMWGGYQRALGRTDAVSYQHFYHGFGIDMMTAQTLGVKEATELTGLVNEHISKLDREHFANG